MKTQTLYYLILILTTLSCKAQILPLENCVNYIDQEDTGIPENITYIKDVNNLLNKYIGVWIGNYDNKAYELRITKTTTHDDGISVDELRVKHKITDNNGNVIEDTTTLQDDNYLVISGMHIGRSGSYFLNYIGNEADCGQFGTMLISVGYNNSNNNMRLGLHIGRDIITADCPNGAATQIFPSEGQGMTLVKQY